MRPFEDFESDITPLARADVDTDQIVPKQFLKLVTRSGFGKCLFYGWRYRPGGAPDPSFVLNDPRHRGSRILAAMDNFGCGSSREHAPIALSRCGVKAVLAPSFARIFYRNCVDGAFLLPVEIGADAYEGISDGDEMELDTASCSLSDITTGRNYSTRPFAPIIERIISAGGLFKFDEDSV